MLDLSKIGSVCSECAKAHGAVWPEGHVCGWWYLACDVCGETKHCTAPRDWKWPGERLSARDRFYEDMARLEHQAMAAMAVEIAKAKEKNSGRT